MVFTDDGLYVGIECGTPLDGSSTPADSMTIPSQGTNYKASIYCITVSSLLSSNVDRLRINKNGQMSWSKIYSTAKYSFFWQTIIYLNKNIFVFLSYPLIQEAAWYH